ncbi:family 78 glycoside hydrolase catalytic domain [Solibaculum mannosilyticum]|uniref:alpha-L-rhamnosidase n=1 Tax=Solibaculum mannosilyticum TaxID=2780922 RepID=A0A7I8CZA1_9FIRM|nr:family 78 glycoside hydrolase catalytic domain [Solibaculum mannosilyticum]BCI59736.1 hypothetical protein C12CBH8_03750 [Solibaculum mannosilyticum]
MKWWKQALGILLSIVLLVPLAVTPWANLGASANGAIAEIQVNNLKVCSLTDPLGIDKDPVFSWVVSGSAKDDKQDSYQIVLATDEEDAAQGKGTVWDSGKIAGEDTVDIAYSGPALNSRTTYFWKVTVWSHRGGQASSEVHRFSTGILDGNWEGQWIGFPQEQCDVGLTGANWIWNRGSDPFEGAAAGTQYFRFSFAIPEGKSVERFELAYTVDDNATIYLNGKEVGSIDLWSDGSFYNQVDGLVPGENVVAVRATNATVGYAGMIANIRITYSDGSQDTHSSDQTWKVSSHATDGWQNIGYDDSAWGTPDQAVAFGSSPWGTGVSLKAVGSRAAVLLRKDFEIDKPVKEAYAYICGLGFFDLKLNEKAPDDSVLNPFITQYDQAVLYRTFDVTSLLQEGGNAIGVELGNSYYNEIGGVWNWGTAAWRDDPKLMFRLDIRYQDNTSETIVSDPSWASTNDGPIASNSMYYGDVYDARKEMTGYASAGYDDSSWQSASVAKTPSGTLEAQMKAPVSKVASFEPEEIVKLGEGSYRIESPEMVSGWILLKNIQQDAGDKITITYGQKLDEDGSVHKYGGDDGELSSWYPHAYFQQDIYYASGNAPESYEPKFSYKGFEYVQIDGYDGELTKDDVVIYRVSNDVEVISEFESSNEMFNRLHQSMRVAMTDNFQGEHCDPMLEKNGWLGDANVSLGSMMFTFDMPATLPGWIEVMEDCQEQYGLVPQMVPTANWGISNAAVWNTIFVYGVQDLERYFGTGAYTEEQYDAMRQFALRDIQEVSQNNWVWRDDDPLADWVSPIGGNNPNVNYDEHSSEGSGIVGTAFVYGMLEAMAEFADDLGKTDDAAEYRSAMENIYQAFNEKFYNEQAGIYETTVWTQIGNRTKYRQTSNLVPLAFGLVPEDRVESVLTHLVEDIIDKEYHLDTGCVGTRYILPILCDYGYEDIAYRIATQTTYPSWGYWLQSDSKSTWEMWEATTRSFDHYFLGTYEEWFYSHLAGIQDVDNGYQTFTISPEIIGDLEDVSATVQTVRGELASSWQRNDDGTASMQVTVPFGSTAAVLFPTADKENVILGDSPISTDMEGVRSVEAQDGQVCVTVGSGTYEFKTATDLISVYRLALEEIVAEAEDYLEDPLYESAKEQLEAQVASAKGVLEDSSASQQQVNEAAQNLREFLSAMVGSESRIQLRQLIVECQKMRLEGYYLPDAWQSYQSVLAEAKQMVEDLSADDSALNQMITSLQEADKQLDTAMYPNLALGKQPSASSTNESPHWCWGLQFATDGDRKNVSPQEGEYAGYCSSQSASVDHAEWLQVDLGSVQTVNHVVFYPSSSWNGEKWLSYGFPVDFRIQLSDDGTTWRTVHDIKDYPLPEYGPLSFAFPSQEARYVRLCADSLRPKPSDNNSYHLQICEMEVYSLPEPEEIVTPDKDSYLTGETITLTIRTEKEVDGITLFNENGRALGLTKVKSIIQDHEKIWTIQTAVETPGDRTIQVMARKGGVWTALADFSVQVVRPEVPEAVIYEASVQTREASVNERFTVEIQTNQYTESIVVKNERGKAVTCRVESCEEQGEKRLFTVSMEVGTAGDRIFSFYAVNGNGELSRVSAEASVRIK